MENLYQIPAESCSVLERKAFWDKVIADQNISGISAKKFCKLHQLKYTTYKGYKYRRLHTKINCSNVNNTNNKLKNIPSNNCAPKFVPLQITTDTTTNKCNKNEIAYNQDSKIQIAFKNKHSLILPQAMPETQLLLIIKTVAELPC